MSEETVLIVVCQNRLRNVYGYHYNPKHKNEFKKMMKLNALKFICIIDVETGEILEKEVDRFLDV